MNSLLLVLLHLGKLHPFERGLVGVIAFGPFIVLAVVVYVVRKRDIAEEEDDRAAVHRHRHSGDSGPPLTR